MRKAVLLSTIVLLFASLLLGLIGCTKEPVELNVSAAYSLTDALKEINDVYMQENDNVKILANFAASGTLQTQIESGAPVDVFFPAGAKQMDNLQNGGLILTETRKDLLKNKVVLIVNKNSALNMTDFTGLLNNDVKKVAIGDPEFVPAGDYAKQAFDLLDIYQQVKPKLILGSDVRQVLSYVESGDVDAGIVYSTDAAISTTVKVVANGPDAINAKIVYLVAVVKASIVLETAKEYVNFLSSDKAEAIFEKYGFSVIS